MNVLCLDHVCHKKTKSFDFFLDILREGGHAVEVFYYERHYHVKPPMEMVSRADVIVYLEFLPSRFRLLFPGKRVVYLPMYDNEWGSVWQWRRIAWSGMGVISFCKKVSDHARKCGVKNILDVRYFPDPAKFPHSDGERKRVFLWERGDISRSTAEKLFPPADGFTFDIKRRDEFLEREEYLHRLSRCEIVIAPRRKEGIGMAFLEAMAMGKCVAAHNDATMNEYIKDGYNGILFDADNPYCIAEDSISKVMGYIKDSVAQFRFQWMNDVLRIPEFIVTQKPGELSFAKRMTIAMSYPMLLLEGIWRLWAMRLFKRG